jgi:hypothetical protein
MHSCAVGADAVLSHASAAVYHSELCVVYNIGVDAPLRVAAAGVPGPRVLPAGGTHLTRRCHAPPGPAVTEDRHRCTCLLTCSMVPLSPTNASGNCVKYT